MSNPLFKVMCSGTSTGGTIVDGNGETVNTPYIWDLHCESNRYQSKVFNNYESDHADNSKIYIKVKLKAGTLYDIGMNENKSFDGKIWLYDAEGNCIAENDDASAEINGIQCRDVLNFTPDTDGDYIIAPGCWSTSPNSGGEFYIVMNPAPEKESSGGAGGGNIIEPDSGSYIIDVRIDNTSSSIIISDDGAFCGGTAPVIDWGDGTVTENDWSTGQWEHYYSEPGTYRIIWKNGFLEGNNSFYTNENQITNVEQISNYRVNFNYLFKGCQFAEDVTIKFDNFNPDLAEANSMFSETMCTIIRITSDSPSSPYFLWDFGQFFANSTIVEFYAFDGLFGRDKTNPVNFHSAFLECFNLNVFADTYGTPGGRLHYDGNFNYMFKYCYNLSFGVDDWNALGWTYNWTLPLNGYYGATRSVYEMFAYCYNLGGTVNPQAFWDNPEASSIYTSYENCFLSTDNLNKPNVPDSWA